MEIWEFIKSLTNPETIIQYGGLVLILLIVFAENGIIFGFFLPGDSLIFLAGLICSTQPELLDVSITTLSLSMFGAAVAGSLFGYYFGMKVGPPVFERNESMFFKKKYVDGVYLQCPGKKAVLISNGKDGESCSSTRQDSKSRVKITCGESVSYVYDGKNGQDGTSCSATPTEGGAYINCGDNKPVFLADGENGIDGEDGVDGTNGKDAIQPGLLCQVYDSQSIDRSNGLLRILANATSKFEVVVNQLDTGDTRSSMGYPKFTAAQQAMIGTEDYAMDCSGYLNVPISGNYLFHLFSDDGSKLAIKDALVIDFDGLHSPQEKSSESTLLYKGPNKINVLYFQGPNTQIALDLDWTGPNFSRQQLPAAKLTH